MPTSADNPLSASYRAARADVQGGDLYVVSLPLPVPDDNEVLIKVEACGVCYGDVHAITTPGVYPRTPGHEVIGRIAKAGARVPSRYAPGARIGVGWAGGHCFNCDPCRQGAFASCSAAPPLITGMTRPGGYAEYMVARYEAVAFVPEDGDAAEMAPLMCAGLTCFNSIRNMGVPPGSVVAVQGIGGLGHLALQICRRFGFRTVAITTSPSKAEAALALGADEAVAPDAAVARLKALGGARLIVATAPSSEAIEPLVDALGLYGTLLLLAVPGAPLKVSAVQLVHHRARVMGWNSGHAKDSEETIEFCKANNVVCQVERFSLDEVVTAYNKMKDASVRFRSVLVF
ncbi:zinc-type alcohol dehydrogenase [Zopfochytrium polystomum]|nr:zinc-type alcohol dehydrogenase [Zopfochytrium polystomum]